MSDRLKASGSSSSGNRPASAWDQPDGGDAETPARDWKRLFLVAGLGILSWVATYVGMLELIEANVGELPLVHKAIIGFSVAMLMVMVVWLLDQIFSELGWLTRLIYVAGYVFLTVISVGFGFGFYWKVLESRGESSRSAESAVGQVQNALHAGLTRLEQLQATLDSLTQVSAEKAALERQSGTSCPASRPGDGPRRQLREDDAARFKFAADFVRGRVGAIKAELGGLGGDLGKVMSNDRSTVDAGSGTRNEFMRGLNRRLDMTVTGFNAFRSDPQLKQIRSDLAERSDRVTFPDTKGGTFQCPDAQLGTALKGVVRAIDELPMLEKPKIQAVEGSEAVIEAFRRLSATMFGALSFKLPPSPEELRELQKKAVQSVEGGGVTQARLNALGGEAGLSKRDYVPLAIALFVDLCLLLVSIRRPASPLDRLVPKMRAAERGPVIQILSRFNDIHRDPAIRENFEVFRHVVFDFHGDYYAAVPLNAPYRANPRNGRQAQGYGVSDAEALVQEAHLLANLFASFEKERIFSRVMSPLLSTATVQRRLRRQGSKFANAEAFRVYRFRDGAWSEIILGAVMGAARRVEARDRRRQFEEELFASPAPDLGGVSPAALDRGRRRPEDRASGAGRHVEEGLPIGSRPASRPPEDLRRPPFMPRIVPVSEETSVGEPRQPANSNTAPRRRAEPAAHPEREGARIEPAFSIVTSGLEAIENVVLHPAVARPSPVAVASPMSPSGPQPMPPTGTYGPEPETAQRSAPPVVEEVRIAAPMPLRDAPEAASEPTVTVAATRETVTYTLPVSEARLPHTLLARAGVGARGATAADAPPRLADAGSERPATAWAEADRLPPPPKPPRTSPSPATDGRASGEPMAADGARDLALRLAPAPGVAVPKSDPVSGPAPRADLET